MGIPVPVQATVDERSFKQAGDKAERAMADAGRNAGRSFSDAISGATKDAEGALKKFGDKASDSYDKARDAAGRLRTEEEKLQALRQRAAGNDQIVSQVERVEKARRAEARAIRDAKDALADYYEEAGKGGSTAGQMLARGLSEGMAGTRIGQVAGGGITSGLMSGTAGVGALMGAAIGAGVVAAAGAALAGLWSGIQDGMASLRMKDLMQTRMGIDDASMHRMGDAAGRAYASGFGESVQDNLAAIQFGLQGGLISPNASTADIAKYTERIQTTSQVMNEDPDSIARGARNLLRTGLVQDYSQALDLLTAATGKGLNLTKDLIDTAEEYGTAWHGVGLSASDAFGLIKQMSDAGIRNTDVAADSIKELSINVADGSKLTKSAFEAMGLNADDMTKRFAEGGPAARDALAEVLTGLRNLDDPTQKQLVGLALFKTKWEDAKTAIQNANLSTAANEMGDVSGATDTATDKINAHADAWDKVGRNIGQVMTKLDEWLANTAIGKFFGQGLPNFLNDLMTPPGSPYQGYTNPDAQAPVPWTPGQFLSGAQGGPGAPTTLGQLIMPDAGQSTPAAPGQFPGTPPAPSDIPHQPKIPMSPDADKGPAAKFNADPSKWSLDSVPLGSFPGEEGISAPPVAPAGPATAPGAQPQIMWGTGDDPYGKAGYGYYQVDQGRVFDAQTSQMSAQASLQNARFHFLEVQAKADATEQEKYNARTQLVQAGRALQSAETKLAEAQQGTWKKMESAAKSFGQGMDQIGVALDNDLGISKGLPGLAENLVKFVGSLAAAPLEAQLAAISKANPIQGGHGLMGILGAQGLFGSQYTQSQYGMQGYGPGAGPTAMRPTGAPSEDQVKQIAATFGLKVTSEDRPGDPGYHGQGMALDVSNGGGNTPQMRAFADYMSQNFGPYLKELIYSDGSFSGLIGDGKNVTGSSYYGPDTLSEHQNHVHVAAQWGAGIDASAGQASSALTNLASAAASAAGGAESWRGTVAAVVDQYGPQMGVTAANRQQWIDAIVSQIGTESKGNPNADNPNDSNGQGGTQHVSGLLQYLPESYAMSGGKLTGLPYMDPVGQIAGALFAPRNPDGSPSTTAPGGIGAGHGWGPVATPIGQPGSVAPSLSGVPMMPGGLMAGPPTAAPFARTPGMGGIAFPATPGGGGPGLGGGLMEGAMMAAGGLDMLAPGAGQAAQLGMKLANRAIQFGGQAAGIGVSGLMETLLPSGSPLGSIGNSWFGKAAGAIASARPALPNTAGKQAPPNPNANGQGNGQSGTTIGTQIDKLEFNNNEATQGNGQNDLVRNLTAQNAPVGRP